MYSLIVFAVAALAVLAFWYFTKGESEEKKLLILKILAVTFSAIGLIRYIFSDSFAEISIGPGYDVAQSLARWFYYMGYAVVPLSVFFKSRLFRNLVSYFFLPAAIFSTILFKSTMEYFLDPTVGWIFMPAVPRYVFYIVELSLAVALPIIIQLNFRHVFDVKNKEEWKNFLLAVPAILYRMMPVYIPRSLFGYTEIDHASFSEFHLGWMAFMVVEIVVLLLYFRKRSYEDKYKLCVFLTVAQVFNTMCVFLRGFRINRLPIQLCSIAALFYFVAIIFKKKKLFDFCFVANIIGALIAIFLASFDPGALMFWNIHYVHEHTFVLMIPILAAALGVFPRVDKSSLKFIWGMFSIYFLACLVSGTIINGFEEEIGYTINFFYMLDVNEAVSYVPFVGFVGAWELNIGRFTVYPILVAVVYVMYMVLCGGFYAIMQYAYAVRDGRASFFGIKKKTVKAAEAEMITK